MSNNGGKPPAGAKKARGSAPEWHFADEGDASDSGRSQGSGTASFLARNKFLIRAAAVLLVLVGFICLLDVKESKYLMKSTRNGSSWYVTKPHWQSTEEMKLRLRKTEPSDPGSPHIYPGQREPEDDHWMNDVDAEEWLKRMDTVANRDVQQKRGAVDGAQNDDVLSDYEGIYDYA